MFLRPWALRWDLRSKKAIKQDYYGALEIHPVIFGRFSVDGVQVIDAFTE